MRSTSAASSGKEKRSSHTGQAEIMMLSSSLRLKNTSSVMKGMKGWSSFSARLKTSRSVQSAASRVGSSLFQRRGFTISMYQSQNSSQIKS